MRVLILSENHSAVLRCNPSKALWLAKLLGSTCSRPCMVAVHHRCLCRIDVGDIVKALCNAVQPWSWSCKSDKDVVQQLGLLNQHQLCHKALQRARLLHTMQTHKTQLQGQVKRVNVLRRKVWPLAEHLANLQRHRSPELSNDIASCPRCHQDCVMGTEEMIIPATNATGG